MRNPRILRALVKPLIVVGLAGAGLSIAVMAPSLAAAEPSEAIEELDVFEAEPASAATGYLLAGKWYRQVDEFDEQCGLGSLAIETQYNVFTGIPRGKVKYVTPYTNKNDTSGGRFDWKCASNLEHSECSDSPSGADYIRVFWNTESRRINVRCFERCGDGSHESDCS